MTRGTACACPSICSGPDLCESTEEDALGLVGEELLELRTVSAVNHAEGFDLSYGNGGVVMPLRATHPLCQALELHSRWTGLPELRF